MGSTINQKVLHIVNDTSSGIRLTESGISGDILVWQDALYEGPVVAFKDIDKMAKARAKYFAARGYGDYAEIEAAYLVRNHKLKAFRDFSEVVLWFDHDVFGQLQLAQLIAWLNRQDSGRVILSHIHLEHLTSGRITPRLSQLPSSHISQLFNTRTEITLQQANICQAAWDAFSNSTPIRLNSFYPKDLSSMPFIKNAFARLIQEFPAKTTGLSRTEFLMIEAVKNKNLTEDAVFFYVQKKEPVPFMSKTIFHHQFNRLLTVRCPVLQKKVNQQETVLELEHTEDSEVKENTVVHDYSIKFTHYTNQVLNKWADWVQLNGINRWIGGVHLNEGSIWRYDPVTRRLNKTYV